MLVVRTFVGPSEIHGTGLFAAEPIKKGEAIWIFNPLIDLEITMEEIETLPEEARRVALAHTYMEDDGRLILSRDNAVFFNHSEAANTSSGGALNVALRDIAAGEELTEDYRRFRPAACNAFLFEVVA